MAANTVEIRRKLEEFISKYGYPHEFMNRIVGFTGDMQITLPFTEEQCDRVHLRVTRKGKELARSGQTDLAFALGKAMGYLAKPEKHAILQQIIAERSGAVPSYPPVRFSPPPTAAQYPIVNATSAPTPPQSGNTCCLLL